MTSGEAAPKPVQLNGLAEIPWIRHGFTDRLMGNMAVSRENFLREGLPEQVRMALRNMGMNDSRAVLAEQVHEDRIRIVEASDPAPAMQERTDALICREHDTPLITFGADCPNIFLADNGKKAIGLVHSGRRGTLARIVPKTIIAMEEQFGSRARDITAVISPSVGPCCYPVDLWGMLEEQLEQCGVGKIFNGRVCTSCNADRYFSYRKSGGRSERMIAAIVIASQS